MSLPEYCRADLDVSTETRLDGDAVQPKGSAPLSKLSKWQMKDVDGEGVPVCDELDVCVALELGVPVVLLLGVPVVLLLGVSV